MKKITIFALIAILAISALNIKTASAQLNNTAIIQLLNQIKELQAKIDALKTEQKSVVQQLTNYLKEGDRGELVEQLQALLSAEGLYDFRITGFFGPITRDAVKAFQKKHDLPQVGRVGPLTLEKLKIEWEDRLPYIKFEDEDDEDEDEDDNHGKKACLPPGWLISPGQLKKGLPNLPPCKDPLPFGISKLLGQGGPGGSGTTTGTTTPDTTVPVISQVTANKTSASSTQINWLTNELATSKVSYNTSSGVLNSTTTQQSSSSLFVTTHGISLQGLTSSTTYYYVVSSADKSGNTATSSEYSFLQ